MAIAPLIHWRYGMASSIAVVKAVLGHGDSFVRIKAVFGRPLFCGSFVRGHKM
jgi:hypothetical protein